MDDASILIGLREKGGASVELRHPVRRLLRHLLVCGGTGRGKSMWLAGIIAQLVATAPGVRVLLLDGKGELAALMHETILPALSTAYPHVRPDRVLSVHPHGRYRVGLDPLVPMPGVDPVQQAWGVVTALGSAFELGERMQSIALNVIAATILAGGTLLDVLRCLEREGYARAVAARVSDPDLAGYLAEVLHGTESAASVSALRARLDALLRIQAMREPFCSGTNISGADLLSHPFASVSTSGIPLADLRQARLIQALVFARLVSGVFARSAADAQHPVVCVADEAAEWLRAEGGENFERLLSLARSRGCFLWLAVQTLKQLADVSPLLVESARVNCDSWVHFRPEKEEVRQLEDLLPVTGGRRNPRLADRVLTAAEERAAIREQLSKLPARTVLYADRLQGEAQILRTPNVDLALFERRAASLSPEVREAFVRGACGVPAQDVRVREPLVRVHAEPARHVRREEDDTDEAERGNRRGRGRRHLNLVLPGGEP